MRQQTPSANHCRCAAKGTLRSPAGGHPRLTRRLSVVARTVPSMSEDESARADLSWFYQLAPAAQVALLRDPHGALSGELAVRLAIPGPGVYQELQTQSDGGSASLRLSPSAAEHLAAIRLQLDEWWSHLPADQQAYVIENRRGELDGEYREIVLRASRDPVGNGPHAHLVVVVSDNKTGRFRLPQMIQVYVEMKTAE